MNKCKKNYKQTCCGFSLTELIVVVAILAILSSISLPAYLTYLDHSAFGACQRELGTFKTQVLASDHIDDTLVPFAFGACAIGGDGQPNQAAVAAAFGGIFEGENTALLIDTQRQSVQAQITQQGRVERVLAP
ncbi:MAG: pilin [Pseudomonadota bacterium]